MPTNQSLQQLYQFIDDLLRQAYLDKLPEKFKEEYKDKILVELQKRIGVMALNNLSDKDVEKFNVLLKKTDVNIDDIMQFLKEKLPDIQTKIDQVMDKFQQEFLKSAIDTRMSL